LLLVDLAMAGPLVCIWLRWRAARLADAAADRVARRLAVMSLAALVAGGLLGGVLLGLRYLADDQAYLSAVAAIPIDRLWFAGAELVFGLVCLGAYVGLWQRWQRRPVWHGLLAAAGSTNLLVHFPALFAIISLVSTRPELAGVELDRAGFRRLLVDGEVLSRVAHVWMAAAAVSGVVVALLALRAPDADEATRSRLVRFGGRLALVATVVQFPVGLWVLSQLPNALLPPLVGSDWIATGLFLTAVLLAVQLLHTLLGLALGDSRAGAVRRSAAVLVVLTLLMVGARLRLDERADRRTPWPSTSAGGPPCVGLAMGFNRARRLGLAFGRK
jgi:hypothetical protein